MASKLTRTHTHDRNNKHSYLAKLHAPSVAVSLTPEVALGCAFLVAYNVILVAAGHYYGGRLPRGFAVFARCWYLLYFCAACASGFGLLPGLGGGGG
jgi:hypothetical protein